MYIILIYFQSHKRRGSTGTSKPYPPIKVKIQSLSKINIYMVIVNNEDEIPIDAPVVFMDDDYTQVTNMSRRCGHNVATVPVIPRPFEYNYLDRFARAGNNYALFLKLAELQFPLLHSEPVYALENFHMNKVERWLHTRNHMIREHENPNPKSIVVFDWDYTISRVNGIMQPSRENIDIILRHLSEVNPGVVDEARSVMESITYDDIIQFVVGSDIRIREFRDFHERVVREYKSEIHIFTNNGFCNRDFFQQVVQTLFPALPRFHIHCTRWFAGGDKSAYMREVGSC